jgi:hypothetical protein
VEELLGYLEPRDDIEDEDYWRGWDARNEEHIRRSGESRLAWQKVTFFDGNNYFDALQFAQFKRIIKRMYEDGVLMSLNTRNLFIVEFLRVSGLNDRGMVMRRLYGEYNFQKYYDLPIVSTVCIPAVMPCKEELLEIPRGHSFHSGDLAEFSFLGRFSYDEIVTILDCHLDRRFSRQA